MKTEKRIPCPFCLEKIAENAIKCRYCGEWLNKNPTIKTKFFSKKKIISVIILIIVFLILKDIFWSSNGNSSVQTPPTTQPTEQSLRQVVEEQYQLVNSKNENDLTRLYNEFYSPENIVKKSTVEEFIKNILSMYNNGINHQEFDIHSIKIEGQKGYVDRTQRNCKDINCNDIESQNRSIRLYIFFQNKWLMTDSDIYCIREQPYSNPPEFERIYSLIIQRTSSYKTDYESIKNCVLFRYAESDGEMKGNEGQFSFIPGQSSDKLEILVSPRYKIKDDLTTSILVIHELTHAVNYVGNLVSGEKLDCFKDEASAFQNQNWFISILNQEERKSIDARLATGGSEELRSIKYYWDGIGSARGDTNEDRALNFVKSIPAYQKQCANQ